MNYLTFTGVSEAVSDALCRVPEATGTHQEEGPSRVGCGEQETRQEQAISQVDAAYIAALNRIADAIIRSADAGNRIADAIEFLARATAGEIERDDDVPRSVDISGKPI